jgi:hypothetical protein
MMDPVVLRVRQDDGIEYENKKYEKGQCLIVPYEQAKELINAKQAYFVSFFSGKMALIIESRT